MLEETIKNLIKTGKRNFAVDLSEIDYLYSDSINKLIQLNHQVLNVYGRLALLSPGEEVSRILKRAGVENFLRIYNDGDELKRASDEIIQQTSSISTAAVEEFKPEPEPEKPASEFEDFRTEIGKAFEVPQPTEAESKVPPPPPPSPPPQPTPPPTPPPPKIEKPEVPEIPTFEAKEPEFPPRKEHLPDLTGPKVTTPKEKEPEDKGFKPYKPETKPPFPGEEKLAELTEEDRFTDDGFEKKKKRAPILVFLLLLCICAIGVVAFFAINNAPKKKVDKTSSKTEVKAVEKVPQIEVKTEEPEEVKKEEPVVEKPKEVKKAPAKKTPPKRPKKKYVRKPKPAPKKVTPKKVVKKTVTKPVTIKRIIVTSYPTGATVRFDGKILGKTPYTWKDPSVFGDVTLSVEKNGYNSKKMGFEFTGGIVKKHFVLIKKSSPVVKPKPKPEPKPTPIVKPTPTVEPEPEKPTVTTGGSPGTIFISSLPPMADVYMDGSKIGKTNIDKLKIKSGTHVMKFVKGAKELTKQMTFTTGENPSQLVRLK